MSRARPSPEPELASRVRSWALGRLSALARTLGCLPQQPQTWPSPSELLGEWGEMEQAKMGRRPWPQAREEFSAQQPGRW